MRLATTLLLLVPLISCGEESAPDEVMSEAGDVACQDVDSQSTIEFLTLCAEQGNAKAQTNLGVRYNIGEGVPEDLAEASRLYRLAAQQGDERAQYNIGVMYANGEGVPKDFAEAMRWYRMAAEQEEVNAQFILGWMHANGEGVPADPAEAGRWYRLAAEQGHARAQYNLGLMYFSGDGVPPDEAEALRLVQLAADQGHAQAKSILSARPAELRLPAEFSRTLDERGMMLDLDKLAGYELVPVILNDDMEYDLALRSASGSLEVRYALRWDPGENSFSAFTLATLLNVGTGQDALGPFPPEAVRAEFHADRGVSGPFAPRSTFSSDHDSGIMVAIWAEGRGLAYAFYLFNESRREQALAEWRSVFYALRFRP